MRKKSVLNLHGSKDLSRLVTRERLTRAGVSTEATHPGGDPDLDALFDRVRSSVAGKAAKQMAVRPEIVRKLAGG